MDGGKGQRGRVKLQIVNSEPARTCVACTFCPARGSAGDAEAVPAEAEQALDSHVRCSQLLARSVTFYQKVIQ